MGIEGEEVEIKGIGKISNKITVENFPNLQKMMVNHVQEDFRTPKQIRKKNKPPRCIIVKTLHSPNK